MTEAEVEPIGEATDRVGSPSVQDNTGTTFTGDHAGLSRAADELAASRANSGSVDAGLVDDEGAEASAPSDIDVRTEEIKPDTPKAVDVARPGDGAERLKDALNDPNVRQAIASEFGRLEVVRREYAKALDIAGGMLRESLVAQFPELKSETAEQFQAALNKLAEEDPSRYANARALTDRLTAVQAAQQLDQQHRQEDERRAFVDYAKEEDGKFDAMLKNEKPEAVQRVANEVIAYAEELGVPRDQFLQLCRTERIMRNAAFQKMMYDAASYRLLQRARNEVTRKEVPPVQRPGASVDAKTNANDSELRALSARFASNPSPRAAAEVLMAQRRGAGANERARSFTQFP